MSSIKKTDPFEALIQAAPEQSQALMRELRVIIESTVPDAEPYISYGIPSYKKSGQLVGFGGFKNHVSLFMLNGSFLANPPFDLSMFEQTKSSIHFPLDKKLPVTIIKKIIKARIVENIAKEKIKAEKKKKK